MASAPPPAPIRPAPSIGNIPKPRLPPPRILRGAVLFNGPPGTLRSMFNPPPPELAVGRLAS